MKFLKLLFIAPVLFFVFLVSTTPFSGCKKEVTHDTVIVKHDTTIIKHDTLVKTDSIYDITEGLVAYYNFNGGTVKDSSGYNNHIVYNNATVTADRFGRAGNAYLFNGSSSYMRVANSASLNPNSITLQAIVKINSFLIASCHINNIIGKGWPDYANGWSVLRFADPLPCGGANAVDSAHEYFYGAFGDNNPGGTGTYSQPDTIAAKTGIWYTLTYTYDGMVSKFYINGVLKDSRIKTAIYTPNSNDIFIGKYEDPSWPYWFSGVIDDVRIYNRALGQGAVTQLYKLNK
ncbi:MAG TPA: LamG domain-containing protein [Puia sp.]|nr:LamG domain-containing protein [Puia sp.]